MKAIIIGAGDYGAVYRSYLLEDTRFDVVGFLDDDCRLVGTTVSGLEVLGTTELLLELRSQGVEAVFAPIGNNKVRIGLLERARAAGLSTPNFIHRSVQYTADCVFGEGVYILANCSIMPFAHIDDFTMISVGSNVAHHSTLGRGVFLAAGVNVGANVVIREGAFCGYGATVITGVKDVGEYAVVGAGSVVIRDVAPGVTVAGVPAKVLHKGQR